MENMNCGRVILGFWHIGVLGRKGGRSWEIGGGRWDLREGSFCARVEGGKITGNDQPRSVTSPMHFVMIFGQKYRQNEADVETVGL